MPKRNHRATTTKKYTRPGVEAAAHLLSLPLSTSRWNAALKSYEDMLHKKGGAALVQLDSKLHTLANSNDRWVTKDQLMSVVIPWKFGKGKPRNALKPLLQSNSDESVVDCSKRAIKLVTAGVADDTNVEKNDLVKDSIDELCNLRGVGPATASAILSVYHPNQFVFMDDEVIEALYEGKRGYTLKIYEVVNERCGEICKELNSQVTDGDTNKVWTRCEVGKVLWTVAAMKAFGQDKLLNSLLEEDTDLNAKRRKK